MSLSSRTFFGCANDAVILVLHIIYVNLCIYVYRQESGQVLSKPNVVGVCELFVPLLPCLASANPTTVNVPSQLASTVLAKSWVLQS